MCACGINIESPARAWWVYAGNGYIFFFGGDGVWCNNDDDDDDDVDVRAQTKPEKARAQTIDRKTKTTNEEQTEQHSTHARTGCGCGSRESNLMETERRRTHVFGVYVIRHMLHTTCVA